jgi:DNA-binding transcriptional ArsR family regulator
MTGNVPLYQAKAELFRTLGHPIRIRVLELLQDGPRPVHELLAELPIEPSNFSQQLAVLRRTGLVSSSREGATVMYTLSTPHVAELLLAGRRILAAMWTDTEGLLTQLRETSDPIQDEGVQGREASGRPG